MIKNIKSVVFIFMAMLLGFSSCKKETYSFGDIKTPTNLALTAVVAGANTANPTGNGTGTVSITASSTDAITYKIDFGDGNSKVVSSGTVTYKYLNPGTFDYTITVNAIGTGGATSSISKKITVFVLFEIPPAMLLSLTNGSSKVWISDKTVPGHFGVGAADMFFPNYYAAAPNERAPCAYDDEITFSRDANKNVSLSIDNKGESFSIGAATGVYGFSGGDGCYAVNTGGVRKLGFSDATSASTSAISTRIQFAVPGNGIINFGTGGKVYEILSISNTQLHLRNIGSDGNSWYQILKAK
jgi:PKD domain